MMTQNNKQRVADSLRNFCARVGGQNKAANMLSGVSSATISQALNGKWEMISDDMWRKIEAQTKPTVQADIRVAVTSQYRDMYDYITMAQTDSCVHTIVGDAGCGKTTAINEYKRNNSNVIAVSCASFWTKKNFLREIMKAAGIEYNGGDIYELENDIVTRISKMDKPVLILDEIDKLSDTVLYFYITFYNKLIGKCGIVCCSTQHLIKRLERGVKLGRLGYQEIRSRMGDIAHLDKVNGNDIAKVCVANGVDSDADIEQWASESNGDLRELITRIISYRKVNGYE